MLRDGRDVRVNALQDADRIPREKDRGASSNVCEAPNDSGPWNPFNPLFDDHMKSYLECFFDTSYDWP
jgi:hypothetical protein